MTMRTDSATTAAPMGRKVSTASAEATAASDIAKAMRAQPVRQFTIPSHSDAKSGGKR